MANATANTCTTLSLTSVASAVHVCLLTDDRRGGGHVS